MLGAVGLSTLGASTLVFAYEAQSEQVDLLNIEQENSSEMIN